jgi:hypothetical protein
MRASARLIAMKPPPLNFESKFSGSDHAEEATLLGLNAFDIPADKATDRLRECYGRLGFVRVPRTEYMVPCSDFPSPPAEALLLPNDQTDQHRLRRELTIQACDRPTGIGSVMIDRIAMPS